MKVLHALGALSLAVLLGACNRSDSERSYERPGVTNRQPVVDSVTVNRLATARCDREQACNNVGAGQKYATHDVCLDEMRGKLANEMNSYTCPGGFDRVGLQACVSAIQTEECGNPLDTIERIDKCRKDALCAK